MKILNLYKRLARFPGGKWLFTKLICYKAPYFSTIHPKIYALAPGQCVVTMDKRRMHQNHIGTVHAIAMCNMAELAAGLAVDVSMPEDMRWIPKAMTVNYLKKATTTLKACCTFAPDSLNEGDNVITVVVMDKFGNEVFVAEITMYLSMLQ